MRNTELLRSLAHLVNMHNHVHMSAPNLLNTEQVAARVGKDPSTVNRWAKSGKLPVALKLPGLRGDNLFAVADVLAFIQEGTNQ